MHCVLSRQFRPLLPPSVYHKYYSYIYFKRILFNVNMHILVRQNPLRLNISHVSPVLHAEQKFGLFIYNIFSGPNVAMALVKLHCVQQCCTSSRVYVYWISLAHVVSWKGHGNKSSVWKNNLWVMGLTLRLRRTIPDEEISKKWRQGSWPFRIWFLALMWKPTSLVITEIE